MKQSPREGRGSLRDTQQYKAELDPHHLLSNGRLSLTPLRQALLPSLVTRVLPAPSPGDRVSGEHNSLPPLEPTSVSFPLRSSLSIVTEPFWFLLNIMTAFARGGRKGVRLNEEEAF